MQSPLVNSAGVYPRNLSYIVKRLQFVKNTYKLLSLNQNSASNNGFIVCDLPANSMCDLSSVTMNFNLSTTVSSGAAAPSFAESLIEKIEVEANGIIIGGGSCSYLNHLYNIFYQTTCGTDARNRRSVLQNGGDGVVPAGVVTNQIMAIQSFLGFISSSSPNILDTNITGPVRLRISLASPAVLLQAAATTGAAFNLSNISFTVDVIDIPDGIFANIREQYLQQGGVFEVAYRNWYSFSSPATSLSQSCKFSLSTGCLNRVIATFVPGTNYPLKAINGNNVGTIGANLDTITKLPTYFTRIGGNSAGTTQYTWGDATNNSVQNYKLDNYQFNLNNQMYPNFTPTSEQAFGLMLNSFGMSQSRNDGLSPNLNSLTAWNSGHWLSEISLDYSGEPVNTLSGLDLRGSSLNGYWNTNGTTTPGTVTLLGGGPSGLTALVFVESTAVLRISAGRQLEVVF